MEGTNASMCWCLLSFFAMKLHPHLTREQLQQLVDKERLHRLLASTPLNLPAVALYALLYMFMPAALLGPFAGLLGTLVLAAVAAWLWLWGTPDALDSFLWFWLAWGALSWFISIIHSCVSGVLEYRLHCRYLTAVNLYAADLKPGMDMELAGAEVQNQELTVQVPQRGVYVLVCRVDECASSVSMQADERACLVEVEQVPGLRTELRMAFRLEPGYHQLRFSCYCPEGLPIRVLLR